MAVIVTTKLQQQQQRHYTHYSRSDLQTTRDSGMTQSGVGVGGISVELTSFELRIHMSSDGVSVEDYQEYYTHCTAETHTRTAAAVAAAAEAYDDDVDEDDDEERERDATAKYNQESV